MLNFRIQEADPTPPSTMVALARGVKDTQRFPEIQGQREKARTWQKVTGSRNYSANKFFGNVGTQCVKEAGVGACGAKLGSKGKRGQNGCGWRPNVADLVEEFKDTFHFEQAGNLAAKLPSSHIRAPGFDVQRQLLTPRFLPVQTLGRGAPETGSPPPTRKGWVQAPAPLWAFGTGTGGQELSGYLSPN